MNNNEDHTEAPTEVSPSYMIVLGQRELTLRFPQFDFASDIYLRARPTLLEEDDIAQAALSVRWDQKPVQAGNRKARRARGERGKKKGEPEEPEVLKMQAAISPGGAFVAKCLAQVTDYRIPVLEKGASKPTCRAYNDRNHGDNDENREIYEYLLQPGAESYRDLIEQFLDYVAGRGNEAQAEFEAFLAEQPRVLADS